VHAAAASAWAALLSAAPVQSLRAAAADQRASWLRLAATPAGTSPDARLLLAVSYEEATQAPGAQRACAPAPSDAGAAAKAAEDALITEEVRQSSG